MSEFGRSGQQMPTEARAEGQSEHEQDLAEVAEHERQVRRAEHREDAPAPWWKFWSKI